MGDIQELRDAAFLKAFVACRNTLRHVDALLERQDIQVGSRVRYELDVIQEILEFARKDIEIFERAVNVRPDRAGTVTSS